MSDEIDLRQAGASAGAIQSHYDAGNDFYRLWLGPTMAYSCALWSGDPDESLETAQTRKIDWHLTRAQPAGTRRLLDIGSGWGSVLSRAVEAHGVEQAVGLTLSPSQADWVASLRIPGAEARLESWVDHRPPAPYDAVVSICAIEAFTKLGLPSRVKVAVYRSFFGRCHAWLAPGGWMSLQAIVYGNAGPQDFSDFIAAEIFPETDLPRLAELLEGLERLFEVVELRNDRADYVRTLRAWSEALRRNRADAVALVGEEKVVRYLRYLKLSEHMFAEGTCDLVRLRMRRIDRPRR